MKTLYVTKYALSSNGRITQHDWGGKVSGYGHVNLGGVWTMLRLGIDAHESVEAAVAAAEVARSKKIASLEKQIQHLRGLKFSVVEDEANLTHHTDATATRGLLETL